MSLNFAQPPDRAPLLVRESREANAKTAPAKGEKELTWAELGECMGYVRYACKLGLEQFAHALGRDYRQVGRMIEGKERPQIELLWTNDKFRRELIVAMAMHSDGVDVKTTISLVRES